MSESSREKAKEAEDQLRWAEHHTRRAKEIVQGVPDKDLQRKTREAHEKAQEAHEHIKKGLEQK